MTKKLTMLVAAHKSATMPGDVLYMPVHVGSALSDQSFGYQRDDAGNNISQLNKSYCELTAMYWAWKNLDANVIGLSHYRRYFAGTAEGPNNSRILSGAEADDLMGNYDIVIGRPRNYLIETVDSHYRNGHHGGDLDTLRAVIAERTPEYCDAYDSVFTGRRLSLYNMFLMKREHFDLYADWLFAVLHDVEGQIANADRSAYQQRTFGYLGERLLNVWTTAHADTMKVKKLNIVNSEGEPKLKKAFGLIQRKLMRGLSR